jgi:CubicO group peptidase (beta-lactamase class C family)
MMKRLFNIPQFVIFLSIVISINTYGQNKNLYFPDSVWLSHDSIENIGYDSQQLSEIRKYIIDSMNTTGLMVVVNGKTLFEYGDLEELSYIASCRKSLLSMMFGKYVKNGTIDLDLTLEELDVNDVNGLLPIEQQATIRDLITARSGIYHPRSNDGDDTNYAPERGSVKPGSYFLYNNWDFNAAGGIFEKLTNSDIYETFEHDVAIPIQMQDFKIEKQQKIGDSTKSNYLAYHFWLSTRDMARIGLLMLNSGNWRGEQIIPADWVKLTTSIFTPTSQMNPPKMRDWNLAYGYMWWILQSDNELFDGAYYAAGAYGQYILILPKLKMVISHKTKYAYRRRTDWPAFKELVGKIIDLRIK